MNIIKGKIQKAQKVVVYGPEGIGKSTFASQFPDPLFVDTEGSTNHLDVARMDAPSSWTMLLQQVDFVLKNRPCKTLVIDTADWAEKLCIKHVIQTQGGDKVTSIEGFGYGKGYVYVEEEFARLLHKLTDLVNAGIHIVLTAHAALRKFEQPDETGSYDQWELKMSKKVCPMVKEWADMVLFANYKTYVVNVDGQGASKGKNKAQGGHRVMYTTHHPCWNAKNRANLPEELPFEYAKIAHVFSSHSQPEPKQETPSQAIPSSAETKIAPESVAQTAQPDKDYDGIPSDLLDLMRVDQVQPYEIQQVVASRGYYPASTPIGTYDPAFISGVLVGAWAQVLEFIKAEREKMPF